MCKEIELIEQMIENDTFDKRVLLDIMKSFGDDIAVIPELLLNGQKVLRTRINEEDLFGFISELSYPPKGKSRTDRASMKGFPMFYASTFTKNVDKTNAYPRIISALETISLLKDKNSIGQKMMTQSVWMVNEDIHVFSFPFSDMYKRSCEEITMLTNAWLEHDESKYSKRSIKFFTFIGDLMATEQKTCIYDITATCVDYVLKHFGFDGVMYPSVPSEGEGLNICLSPSVVEYKLSFSGAAIETIIKNGDSSEIQIIGKARMISETAFEWVMTDVGKRMMVAANMLPVYKMGSIVVLRAKNVINIRK